MPVPVLVTSPLPFTSTSPLPADRICAAMPVDPAPAISTPPVVTVTSLSPVDWVKALMPMLAPVPVLLTTPLRSTRTSPSPVADVIAA